MKLQTFLVISIFVIVIMGYEIPYLGLYIFSSVLLISTNSLISNVSQNIFFAVSLLLILLFGFINDAFSLNSSDSASIITWVAFVVFPVVVFMNNDIDSFSDKFEKMILVLFFMDFATNILLLFMPLPWASLPPIREGDLLPRFPGFKGSQLFSGYLSLIAFCYLLDRFNQRNTYKILLLLVIFNLLLAGSFRFYAIAFFILLLKLFETKIICNGKTHWFFVLFVVFIVVATFLTKNISGSNYLRCLFWQDSFFRMMNVPLIGNGFFILKLEEFNDYDTLLSAGNTESCLLSIGINFGLIVLVLFIIGILYRMSKCQAYSKYLALLIVEASLLCFGGGNTNILDGTVLGLSLVCLTEQKLLYDFSNYSDI